MEKNPTYVAGLEALDTKVSMVVASTVLWGRLFQSWTVRGRNDCCWYCVCGILVAHIGRCGLFFVGLQQAVTSLSNCNREYATKHSYVCCLSVLMFVFVFGF